MKKEKRSHPRVLSEAPAEVFREDGSPAGSGRLFNLTEFGACLITDASPGIGDTLILRVKLPEEKEVSLPAELVWAERGAKETTCGIRFGNVPDLIKSVIRRHINRSV